MSEDKQAVTDCFVCRKHQGHIQIPGGAIYEDELVYAGHVRSDQGATYLGHLMIEPKRHVPGLAELTDEEAQALGLLVSRLSRVLKASEGAEHIYEFVLGDNVAHLHIHLMPRYPGAPRQYWGVHVDEWPDAPHGGEAEVAALCDRVRTSLANEQNGRSS